MWGVYDIMFKFVFLVIFFGVNWMIKVLKSELLLRFRLLGLLVRCI